MRNSCDGSRQVARAIRCGWLSSSAAQPNTSPLRSMKPAGLKRSSRADQEFDAARFEHVEIVGGIAEVVADAAGGALFLLRERRDRRERGVRYADEELRGVERALRHDIEGVAVDLDGKLSSAASASPIGAPVRMSHCHRCWWQVSTAPS